VHHRAGGGVQLGRDLADRDVLQSDPQDRASSTSTRLRSYTSSLGSAVAAVLVGWRLVEWGAEGLTMGFILLVRKYHVRAAHAVAGTTLGIRGLRMRIDIITTMINFSSFDFCKDGV
jgi:hypothetical protein